MPIPCNPRISFSFAPPDSSDRPFPLTNLIALQTLTQEGPKKKSLIYMDINFYTTCFCPNFSQNRFFFFFTISTFSCFTLLILRFGDQICLNLSASWQAIILHKLGKLTGNSSSRHFVIMHVYIISCQAPNFQHQGRTAEENAFTQKTSLLPNPLLTGYDNTLTIWSGVKLNGR